MSFENRRPGGWAALACLLAGILNGCAVIGPTAIRNGRLTYNDVIRETDSQQMLMAILHNRYDEPSSLLAVASITANVQVTASAAVQLGFGNDDDFEGNLVPFSAGATYEENPTISYTPVAGSSYIRSAMAPTPIAVLAQSSGTVSDPRSVYESLIVSINGIRNPDFMPASMSADPRFPRVVALMSELVMLRQLHWVAADDSEGEFSLVIDRRSPGDAAQVDELLGLLGLSSADTGATAIVLPVSLALHGAPAGGVGISTRSVYRMVEVLSAAIDVPERDMTDGTARAFPARGPVASELRIRYAKSEPERAAVAVPYRDGWYYIDERDQKTKRFFLVMAGLWSAAIANSTAGTPAPVLTVPVSR